MTTDRPIRIALIGAGIFARDAHTPALKALPDDFEVVAVYSRTEKSARMVAGLFDHPVDTYTDLDPLLARDDIEAVDVVMTIPLTPHMIRRALQAGKHVISEKPMAPDVATGRALLDFYWDYRDRVWMVAENWRYNNVFLKAAELVAEGRLGSPIMCTWTECLPMDARNKYYHTPWRMTGDFQGGYLLDGGIHRAAVLRMVLGEVASVTAHVTQVRSDLVPADTLSASLCFDSGALGAYAVTFATGAPWAPVLDVVGDAGALRVGRYEVLEYSGGGELEPVSVVKGQDIDAELAAFARSIRTGEPHRNTPEEGLRDVALIEAILRSAETGRAVQPERVAG